MTVAVAVMLATSCGKGPTLPEINGVKGPFFNIMNGQIIMTVKFLNLQLDAGVKGPIPKTLNSALELAPNMEDGGMMFQLHLSIEDLENISNTEIGSSCEMPDGRPIPGIPGGQLEKCLRVDTDMRDLSFYYNKKLFGVSIPFGFETAQMSGYWNIHYNQKNVAFLGIMGNDEVNDLKATGVIFLRLENLKSKQLKKLLELSQRNPHFMY